MNKPNHPTPETTSRIVILWIYEELVAIAAKNSYEELQSLEEYLRSECTLPREMLSSLFTPESIEALLAGGHTSTSTTLLVEIEQIHKELSANHDNDLYQGCYLLVLPTIVAFRESNPASREMGEIELLCTIMHSHLLRTMSGTKHSEQTAKMLSQIDALFALIDQEYERRHGEPHNALSE